MSTRKVRLDYLALAARRLRDYEHQKDAGEIKKSCQPRKVVDKELINFLRCARKVLISRRGWRLRYFRTIRAISKDLHG